MLPKIIPIIAGLAGLFVLYAFIIGLSWSISNGFAGILGGLPFAFIIAFVLPMAAYDYWDSCIREKLDK
ncbi:MAG: hypothetical protein OXD44_05985 [Gammaproteobacteria bacterium]|nr:hypothetical protein [Gammaproteobacteria bacterium]